MATNTSPGFLRSLLWVLAPWTGAPLTGSTLDVASALLDRAGVFLTWVAAILANPANPLSAPPAWLLAQFPWLPTALTAFATIYTVWHTTHPATVAALTAPPPAP